MSVDDELDKLQKLRDAGTITDEQYERARAKLLDNPEAPSDAPVEARDERRPRRDRDDSDDRPRRRERNRLSPAEEERETRQWSMFLHLSMAIGHAVGMGGIIAPILIWQIKKDELPGIDVHGKNAVNWLISSIVYAIICEPLIFVIVGIPLLIILGVLTVVFPIVAGVKANEGKVWRYPMSITFFK